MSLNWQIYAKKKNGDLYVRKYGTPTSKQLSNLDNVFPGQMPVTCLHPLEVLAIDLTYVQFSPFPLFQSTVM